MVISPTGSTKKGAAAIGRRYGCIEKKNEISNFVISFHFFADDVHEWIDSYFDSC
jgi:hypothetical protein